MGVTDIFIFEKKILDQVLTTNDKQKNNNKIIDKFINYFTNEIEQKEDKTIKIEIIIEQLKEIEIILHDSINDESQKKELAFYVKAIRSSLNDINEVKEIVSYEEYARRHKNGEDEGLYAAFSDPKAGHVRVAYNADKNYRLVNLDNKDQTQDKDSSNK